MSAAEVIEASEVSTPAGLVPVSHQAIVKPAAALEEVLAVNAAYHELYARLLNESDFQQIGRKKFPTKSAWRKLSLAFNVSDHIVSKDYERDDRGRIIRAEVVVAASASNGRSTEGLGACDLFEKCCLPTCRDRSNHTHCPAHRGEICDGARHFSNPQHDIPATAHTRAKNRACADLFGMGQVSAEEVNIERQMAEQEAEAYDPMAHLAPWLSQLNNEELAELKAWREAENTAAGEIVLDTPRRMDQAQVERTLVQIGRILAARQTEPAAEVVP